ncbi:MAG: phage tail protein [candidate division Zixibacteria bacterium]|nr:phage tail protein [candidate division Zixibacteria bacterium]
MSSPLTKTLTIAIAVMITMAMSVSAGVPQLINYQGRLTDSEGEPISDIVALTFTIYDDSTGGNVKWTEAHATVVVENGLFNVLLGSVNPILDTVFSGSSRYLGIKVDTGAEITPRSRLVSVGYAIHANKADTADYASAGAADIPTGLIVMWSGTLANIPTGWALCDGSNGTPDLRNRFIYGVNTGENPGSVGGNSDHTHAYSHTHSNDHTHSNSHTHYIDPASFTCASTGQ